MKGILREEFWRAFHNKRFWLVAILAGITLIHGLVRTLGVYASTEGADNLNSLTLWLGTLGIGYFPYFAVVMATIPYADSLLADRRHGYTMQVMTRCPFSRYILAKLLANFCAGAVAVVVPMALLFIGYSLAYPIDNAIAPDIPLRIIDFSLPSVIEPGGVTTLSPLAYVGVTLLLGALFGGFYATFGLAASLIVQSSYGVIGLPLVFYCLAAYIIPTSTQLRWLGSPEAALSPVHGWFSIFYQYVLLAAIILLFLLPFARKEEILKSTQEGNDAL